LNNLFIILKIF